MKKIFVEITGVTPLLMNNPAAMLLPKTGLTRTTEKRDPQKEAESVLYINSDKKLYVPSTAIKGSMINAASYKKFDKYSAKPMIAGGMMILPEQVLLNTQKWEIDLRTVVIQKARVPKARPKVNEWKLNFEIVYNDKLFRGELLKPILEEAGERVGLLDFRPAKLGSFGMFKVTKWKEE